MLKSKQRVELEIKDGTLTARLCGEIDHHSAVALRRELDDGIDRYRPEILRLDASAVDFMDSSGLGLMMGRYAHIQRLGGRMILCRPSEQVLRIVRMAGMERIITIEA